MPILDELGAWDHPILAIFDSWGNVNVPLPVVERIAHNRSSEVIVTFGPNWFSRRADEDPEQLDSVFGGRDHWQAGDASLSSRDRWQVWLQTYQAALRRAGFRYPLSFEVVPRTGQPLHLVFGTGHIEGVNAMKDAMWHVDGEDGMSFRDPRAESAPTFVQGTLFELPDPRRLELLSLVLGRLSRGPTAVEDLRDWLLIETSRWRKKDAIDAIEELRDGGQVTVEPPGRVTRRSVVRLRS